MRLYPLDEGIVWLNRTAECTCNGLLTADVVCSCDVSWIISVMHCCHALSPRHVSSALHLWARCRHCWQRFCHILASRSHLAPSASGTQRLRRLRCSIIQNLWGVTPTFTVSSARLIFQTYFRLSWVLIRENSKFIECVLHLCRPANKCQSTKWFCYISAWSHARMQTQAFKATSSHFAWLPRVFQ